MTAFPFHTAKKAKSSNPLFLLDEILSGTNTAERQIAAFLETSGWPPESAEREVLDPRMVGSVDPGGSTV